MRYTQEIQFLMFYQFGHVVQLQLTLTMPKSHMETKTKGTNARYTANQYKTRKSYNDITAFPILFICRNKDL